MKTAKCFRKARVRNIISEGDISLNYNKYMFELLASYGIASFFGGGLILAGLIYFFFFRG